MFSSLRYNFFSKVIEYPLGSFSINQVEEFLKQAVFKLLCFSYEGSIKGSSFVFLFAAFLFGFHRTSKKFLTNNHTFK